MKNEETDYVVCPICGEQMSRITWKHLKFRHQMTMSAFKLQFPHARTVSKHSSRKSGSAISRARRTGVKRNQKFCKDCGEPCQGERCKTCYEVYQNSPEYSKHAKYIRSKRPNKYKPKDYICPDCEGEKLSPTSPRCRSCAAKRRNEERYKDPEFREKLSGIHKKVFEEQPEKVQKLRAGHRKFIQDPERKEKFYESREVVSGEEHHWYRDGSCLDSEYGGEFDERLKFQIRQRDQTCQMCGKTEEENGEALSVHHIDGDKENNDPQNLIALCRNCHSKTTCLPDQWELALSLYMEDKVEGEIH